MTAITRNENVNATARTAFIQNTLEYLYNIDIWHNNDNTYAASVVRYLLAICNYLPVRHLVIAERPYSTDIHPRFSSAMSYDPLRSLATPSVLGMAHDIKNNCGTNYDTVIAWFRDSWSMLPSGVVIVNCMLFRPYQSSGSIKEYVHFQRWVCRMLELSVAISGDVINITSLGTPAGCITKTLLQTVNVKRKLLKCRSTKNPAVYGKLTRDTMSRQFTLEEPGVSSYFNSLISTCHKKVDLAQLNMDYEKITQDIIDASSNLVDEIEKAMQEIDVQYETPSLRTAQEEFAKSLLAYRDTVVRDIVAQTMSRHSEAGNKLGKRTEWGNKLPWAASPSAMASSKYEGSVVSDTPTTSQRVAGDPGNTTSASSSQPRIVVGQRVASSASRQGKKNVLTADDVIRRLSEDPISEGMLNSALYFLSSASNRNTDVEDEIRSLTAGGLAAATRANISSPTYKILRAMYLTARDGGNIDNLLGIDGSDIDTESSIFISMKAALQK